MDCPVELYSDDGACVCSQAIAAPYAPTAIPSIAPVAVPTHYPTGYPIAFPTHVPTQKPVAIGTASPTLAKQPTAYPSHMPVGSPTDQPTLKPTSPPVAVPTLVPTLRICDCGTYLDMMTNACINCPENTFAPGLGSITESSCAPCGADLFSPPGSCACFTTPPTKVPTPAPTVAPCKCGYFLDELTGRCGVCQPGTYMGTTGALGCYACPAGYTSGYGACECVTMPTAQPTTLFPTIRPSALPTPVPSRLPTMEPSRHPSAVPTAEPTQKPTLAPSYAECPCGTYFNPVGCVCEPCAANTFLAAAGATSANACIACPEGTYSWSGSCSCLLSPTKAPSVSTQKPVSNPTVFPVAEPTLSPTTVSCPCGTQIIGTQCSPCAPGTYSNTPNSYLQCIPCPSGMYSNAAACTCLVKPTALPSQSPTLHPSTHPTPVPSHAPCGCGTFLDILIPGGACVTCPTGTYLPGTGSTSVTSCAICPEGYFPAADACSCISTPAPTRYPSALPTLNPTMYPTTTRAPSALPTHPTTLPTPAPSEVLGCSDVPYGQCAYDSNGYYVTVICTSEGVGGPVVWSAASAASVAAEVAAEENAYDVKLFVGLIVLLLLALGATWSCCNSKATKSKATSDYVKIMTQEEIPFALSPVKSKLSDYHSQL